MEPEEPYLLAWVFSPFAGPASIIGNKGDSGKENLGERERQRVCEREKTEVELVCLLACQNI